MVKIDIIGYNDVNQEKKFNDSIYYEILSGTQDDFSFIIQIKKQRLEKRDAYYEKQTKPPQKPKRNWGLDDNCDKYEPDEIDDGDYYPASDSDDDIRNYIGTKKQYSHDELKGYLPDYDYYDFIEIPNQVNIKNNLIVQRNKTCHEEIIIDYYDKKKLDDERYKLKELKIEILNQKLNVLNGLDSDGINNLLENRKVMLKNRLERLNNLNNNDYGQSDLSNAKERLEKEIEEDIDLEQIRHEMTCKKYRKALSLLEDFQKDPKEVIIERADYQKDYHEIQYIKSKIANFEHKASIMKAENDAQDIDSDKDLEKLENILQCKKEILDIRIRDLKNKLITDRIEVHEEDRDKIESNSYFHKYYVAEIDQENNKVTLCMVQHYDIIKTIAEFNLDQFNDATKEIINNCNNPNIYYNYIQTDYCANTMANEAVELNKDILPEDFLREILKEFLDMDIVMEIEQEINDDYENYDSLTFIQKEEEDTYTYELDSDSNISFSFRKFTIETVPDIVVRSSNFGNLLENAGIDLNSKEADELSYPHTTFVDNLSEEHFKMIEEFCVFTASMRIKDQMNKLLYDLCAYFARTFDSSKCEKYFKIFYQTMKNTLYKADENTRKEILDSFKEKIDRVPNENSNALSIFCVEILKEYSDEKYRNFMDYMFEIKNNRDIEADSFNRDHLPKRRKTIEELKEEEIVVDERFHEKFDDTYKKEERIKDLGVLFNFAMNNDMVDLKKYSAKTIAHFINHYFDKRDNDKLYELFMVPKVDIEIQRRIFDANPWMSLWLNRP